MVIFFLILFFIHSLLCMENPDRPRYHINNKVIYLKEMHESGDIDREVGTVSEFMNQEKEEKPVKQPDPTPHSASLTLKEQIMSHRAKIIIGLITGCSTIAAAIISSVVTYYSRKC